MTSSISQFILAALLVGVVTLLSLFAAPLIGYLSIALIYLLLVVAVGLRLRRGPVLAVAAASALLWNFLFIPPRLTFYIEKFDDIMMFSMFFIIALAMGHLTSRLRRSELAERQRERRTAALYELAHQAAFATDLETGLRAAVEMIEAIFSTRAALLLRLKDHSLSRQPHPAGSFDLSPMEQAAAARTFADNTPAEISAAFPGDSQSILLPLQGRTAVMGVLCVRAPRRKSFDPSERELLDAFSVLIGLTLEKDHVIEAFKRAEILEASERLRRALLESVSHELKTPLAAVQTGIDALAQQIGGDSRTGATIREIQVALRRQHRVINNLLDMTRIESGVVQPKLDWCDVDELVQAATGLAGEILAEHSVKMETSSGLPMVKVDQVLLEQSLCNLLLNAAANSRAGTRIVVRASVAENKLTIAVLDEGRGIRDGDLTRIFEAFYRASDARPGGIGLGLAIVDGFVRAHGGIARAANRSTGGAEFTLEIPVEAMRPDIMEKLA